MTSNTSHPTGHDELNNDQEEPEKQHIPYSPRTNTMVSFLRLVV